MPGSGWTAAGGIKVRTAPQYDIIAANNLCHVGQGGKGGFHIVSKFGDELSPFGEKLMQMECLFLHLFLKVEIQPGIFRHDIPVSLYHQYGKGDNHAEGTVFLRPAADGRFKMPDCQDTVKKADTVYGRRRKWNQDVGTSGQASAKRGAGEEDGGKNLIPGNESTVPLYQGGEGGQDEDRQDDGGSTHSERDHADEAVQPAVFFRQEEGKGNLQGKHKPG